MKLTSWLALMFAAGAIGVAVAFVFLHATIDRYGIALILVFVLAAVLFAFPRNARGWIRTAFDHLPTFGRKGE